MIWIADEGSQINYPSGRGLPVPAGSNEERGARPHVLLYILRPNLLEGRVFSPVSLVVLLDRFPDCFNLLHDLSVGQICHSPPPVFATRRGFTCIVLLAGIPRITPDCREILAFLSASCKTDTVPPAT